MTPEEEESSELLKLGATVAGFAKDNLPPSDNPMADWATAMVSACAWMLVYSITRGADRAAVLSTHNKGVEKMVDILLQNRSFDA